MRYRSKGIQNFARIAFSAHFLVLKPPNSANHMKLCHASEDNIIFLTYDFSTRSDAVDGGNHCDGDDLDDNVMVRDQI